MTRTLIDTNVAEATSAAEAIEAGGLNWSVGLHQAGFNRDGWNAATGRFATVREDNGKFFGFVGSRFNVIQNADAFGFADNLVDGGGEYLRTFELHGGSVVGLVMKLGETFTIGGEEQHDTHLIMRMKHDGTGALQLGLTDVRIHCLNQLPGLFARAAHGRGMKSRWSIRHTASALTQIEQAREALQIAFTYRDNFVEEAERLMAADLTDERVDAIFKSIVEAQGGGERASAKMLEDLKVNLDHSDTIQDNQRRTAWGVYNAVTEYADWLYPYRTEQSRVMSSLEGRGLKLKATTERILEGVTL